MVSASVREDRREAEVRNPSPSPLRVTRNDEPAHLRHRPGDDWIIDANRPYDPEDPGPFGSPGWRPDRRTGRHRRGELPDPLPSGETQERAVPERPNRRPQPGRSGFWSEADSDASVDARLREDAWHSFITDSAPLAEAHHRNRSAIEREAGGALLPWIRLAQWLIAVIKTLAAGRESEHGAVGEPTCPAQEPPTQETQAEGGPHDRTARVTTMARALAGAQRARSGVPSWV